MYPPVSEIREKTGLSQSRFAALLGVSVRTLQDWGQGRQTEKWGKNGVGSAQHANFIRINGKFLGCNDLKPAILPLKCGA